MAFICIILFIGLAIYIIYCSFCPIFILAFLFVKDINCRYGFHHTILSCIAVCSNLFEAFYHLQHATSNRDNLSRFHYLPSSIVALVFSNRLWHLHYLPILHIHHFSIYLLSNGNKPYISSVLSQTLSPPQSSTSVKFRLPRDFKTLKSVMCRFQSAFTPVKSSSSRRALLIWQNSSDCSIPANLRSQRLAAIPVVELPLNGSRIQSPLSVQDSMIRVKTERGFCVGCLPHDFSQRPIAGSRHTSVICLSSFSLFINL